jgi:hypothetical protein
MQDSHASLLRLTAILTWGLGVLASPAQLLIHPVGKADAGGVEGTLGLGTFEAEYDADYRGRDFDGDIKREFVFGSAAFGITEVVDLAAGAAYAFNTEAEDIDDEDSGYLVGAALRARIWQQDPSAVHLYAQWAYFDEEYGELRSPGDVVLVEGDGTGHELTLGAAYVYTGTGYRLFGGAEIIPYSDAELDVRLFDQGLGGVLDESATADMERDEIVNIRLGAEFDLGAFPIFFDATLIGEETLRIAVAKKL